MRRLFYCGIVASILIALLFSCTDFSNLTMPEKVVVSPGNGRFALPGGSYSIDIGKYLTASKLQRQIASLRESDDSADTDSLDIGKKMNVYDWNPHRNGTLQQYVLEYNVLDYNLNIMEHLQKLTKLLNGSAMGTDKDGKETDTSTPIPIPANIKKTEETIEGSKITMPNLNTLVLDKMKGIEPDPAFNLNITEANTTSQVDTHKFFALVDEETTIDLLDLTTDKFSFEKINFSNGTLDITITVKGDTNPNSDYALTICAELCDKSFKNTLSKSEDVKFPGTENTSKTLSIPLTEFDFPSKVGIRLVGSYTCSQNTYRRHTYTVSSIGFSTGSDKGTRLKKITGLTMDAITLEGAADKLSFTTDKPIGGDSDFIDSATILDGSIEVAGRLPDEWENVQTQIDVSVSGAIAVGEIDNATDMGGYFIHKYKDLSGTEVSCTEKLSVVADDVSLVFSGATIVLNDDGTTPSVKDITCTALINKVGNAEVKIGNLLKDVQLSKTVYQDISTDITNYVDSLKIIGLHMLGSIETDLDIDALWVQPKLTSDAFGLTADTEVAYVNVMEGGTFGIERSDTAAGGNWKGKTLNFSELNTFPQNPSTNNPAFDFAISLDVRGNGHNSADPSGDYDTSQDYVTINSVELGKTYYIKPEFKDPEDGTRMIECEYVNLKLSDDLIPTDPISTGLNMGELFDGIMDSENGDSSKTATIKALADAVKFSGIEGYIYVTMPKFDEGITNPLAGINMQGSFRALYDTDAGELAGSKTLLEMQKLHILDEVSGVGTYAHEDNVITVAQDKLFAAGTYSAKTKENALCELVNEKVNSLTFAYDISLGNSSGVIRLEKDQINALQDIATKQPAQTTDDDAADDDEIPANTSTSLSISIALYIPMQLEIANKVTIDDVMQFATGEKTDSDLLGRDEGSDMEDYTKFSNLIEYVECSYKFEHYTGLLLEASLTGDGIGTKELHFNDTQDKFTFSRTDVDTILKTNPFTPKITVTLEPAEKITLQRDAEFRISLGVTVATNPEGEYEVWSSKD